MTGPRGQAEQPLVGRLAQVREGVGADGRVPDPASGKRGRRAPQADQPPVLGHQALVPGVSAIPGHRPAPVLAPRALEPDLVAGEEHRDAGRRHLHPDRHHAVVPGRDDRRGARRIVARQERPRVQDGGPGDAGAEQRHLGGDLVAGPRGRHRVVELVLERALSQPGPDRDEAAGIVHDALPAAGAEVVPGVVHVLGDEEPLRARGGERCPRCRAPPRD